MITAPFGTPVLPEVKLISAWLSGVTAGGHGARRAAGPDRLAAGVQSRERQQRRAGAPRARRHRLEELLVGQHEARLQQRDLLLQLVRAEAIAERRGDCAGVEAGEERDDPLDRVEAEDRDAIAGAHAVVAQAPVERGDQRVQVRVAQLVRARDDGGRGRGRLGALANDGREQGESSRVHVSTQR